MGAHFVNGGFDKDGMGISLMESATLKTNPDLSLSFFNCFPIIFSNLSPNCFLARWSLTPTLFGEIPMKLATSLVDKSLI